MIRTPLLRIIIAIAILLFTSLACKAVIGFLDEESETYVPEVPTPVEPSVDEQPEQPQQSPNQAPSTTEALVCPAVSERILEAAVAFYDDGSGYDSGDEPETIYLVTYSVFGDQIEDPIYESVSDNLIDLQKDKVSQQEIWDYFITLIPLSQRASLAEYSIVTDGEGNALAAVTQTSYDPSLWSLEVDISDSNDKLNLTYTLIHEYAHLLTLGPEQVTPSVAIFDNPDDDDIYYDEVNACPDYFPGEGCSRPDSYVNAFFNEFWADIYEEWQDINLIEDDDAYFEALDDFYYKNEDRFVTDYAATNPEEDMAEAFTFFVLSPPPAGDNIAEEKILFFYDYPELVQLRDEITNGICSLKP